MNKFSIKFVFPLLGSSVSNAIFFLFQNLLEFLDSAEERFSNMGDLGSDIKAVKQQIEQLKDFKAEVDPHMVKVEALNR